MLKATINILLFASSLMVAISSHAFESSKSCLASDRDFIPAGQPIQFNSSTSGACGTGTNNTAGDRCMLQNSYCAAVKGYPVYSLGCGGGSNCFVYSCPSNSTANGSGSSTTCSCNTGYTESNGQCLLDQNNNGIPDENETSCDDSAKRLTVACPNGESCLPSSVCNNGCKYAIDPDNIDTKYYTQPSSSDPNQVYATNNYLGTSEACTTEQQGNPPETPNELDCTSVGMVNNATNDGCISPESPECPENYVDTLTEAGCQPMACPVCTFWSSVGGSNGQGGCIQNDACHEPILDNDGDGIPNKDDPDIDGDGVPNGSDPDVDGDGIPNSRDPDIDGDGIPNGSDNDIDGDGQPNSVDSDKDGDGVPNENDEQDGAGDGTGDCDGEPEKCELLTNIKDLLNVDDANKDLGKTLGDELDSLEDESQDTLADTIDDFLENNELLEAYQSILPDSPWTSTNAQLGGDCILASNLLGHEFNFDFCEAKQITNPLLNYCLFILTFWGIASLIFERQNS